MMNLGIAEFLIIGVVFLGLILGILVLMKVLRGPAWLQGGPQAVKRKWPDSEPPDDPFLTRLEEQGAIRLEDDGELPELSEDDLYLEDKPKRAG
jgi:hypothetical protein